MAAICERAKFDVDPYTNSDLADLNVSDWILDLI